MLFAACCVLSACVLCGMLRMLLLLVKGLMVGGESQHAICVLMAMLCRTLQATYDTFGSSAAAAAASEAAAAAAERPSAIPGAGVSTGL
jgi:hypothetical protein